MIFITGAAPINRKPFGFTSRLVYINRIAYRDFFCTSIFCFVAINITSKPIREFSCLIGGLSSILDDVFVMGYI